MTFHETEARPAAGIPMLLLLLVTLAVSFWLFIVSVRADDTPRVIGALVLLVIALLLLPGLFIVNPNEAKVLTLFGTLQGHRARARPLVHEPVHEARRRLARACGTSKRASSR